MRSLRKTLVVVGFGVLFLAALVLLTRNREPVYAGKTLSSWLVQFYTNSSPALGTLTRDQQEAVQAVREIGTNAIPCLRQWIRYEPTPYPPWLEPWMHRASSVFGGFWKFTMPAEDKAELAVTAFSILGPLANQAVPELRHLMEDRNAFDGPRRAVEALGFIGKESLPALQAGLTNTQSEHRYLVVHTLQYLGKDAAPALPVLLKCLEDADVAVAYNAAETLAKLGLEPHIVVSALAKALQDSRPYVRAAAAGGLSLLRDHAQPAVTALTQALSDPELEVRAEATNALLAIRHESSGYRSIIGSPHRTPVPPATHAPL